MREHTSLSLREGGSERAYLLITKGGEVVREHTFLITKGGEVVREYTSLSLREGR